MRFLVYKTIDNRQYFICTNTFTINGYGEHWQYTITNDYDTELGHGSDSYGYCGNIYLAFIRKHVLGELWNYLNLLFYEYDIWENKKNK